MFPFNAGPLWALYPGGLQRMMGRAGEIPPLAEVGGLLAARLPKTDLEVVGGVAVIDVFGILTKVPDFFSIVFGDGVYTEITQQVVAAMTDTSVRGILLRVDSPGGEMAGLTDVADAVFAARQDKPVVAVIPDLGASAALYIATQAERVYCNRGATVGSIGTLVAIEDMSKMYEAMGIKMHIVATGPQKGRFYPGTKATDEQLSDLKESIVQPLGETFIADVARGRGWPVERAAALATGEVWLGANAVATGLVDGIRSFDEVLGEMQDDTQQTSGGAASPRSASQSNRGSHQAVRANDGHRGEKTMNQAQLNYLHSLGLASDATDEQVTAFIAGLVDTQQARVASLAGEPATGAGDGAAAAAAAVTVAATAGPEGTAGGGNGSANGGSPADAVAAVAPVVDSLRSLDTDAIRQQARAEERQRQTQVRAMASQLDLGDQWAGEMIAGGHAIADVRAAALDRHAALNPAAAIGASGGSHVEAGADRNVESMTPAMLDALQLRIGGSLYELDVDGRPDVERGRQPHARVREFRHMSVIEMGTAFIEAAGGHVRGMARPQIAREILGGGYVLPMAAAGFHTSSDFPGVLGTAANAMLRAQYALRPKQWPKFCQRMVVNDFRQQELHQVEAYADLPEVLEGAEYTYVTFGEEMEVFVLAKHGTLIAFTWEMLVNDDMGAFVRVLKSRGNACDRLEDNLAFTVVTANAAMGDDVVLFHADHGNLGTAGAPSITTFDEAFGMMAVQQSGDAYIQIEPKTILCPAALRGTVNQMLESQFDPNGTIANAANTWKGRLDPVSHPLLDVSSETEWYLAGDPNQAETIVVAFLRGEESPTLEDEKDIKRDVRVYKVRHAAAAKAADWRGLFKNPYAGA